MNKNKKDIKNFDAEARSLIDSLKEVCVGPFEIDDFLFMDDRERTEFLVEQYSPDMTGRPLGSLFRALKNYGDREAVSDFLVEVVKGPAVPAQLLALKMAEGPGFCEIPKVKKALEDYLEDFECLTQAFSYYQDKLQNGCENRSCNI